MKTQITWQNIPIEIDYDPNYSKCYLEAYGYGLAHIQVRANQPLPITGTGYKSQFIAEPCVAMYGTVVDFVTKILDTAATDPRWQQQQADRMQLDLF